MTALGSSWVNLLMVHVSSNRSGFFAIPSESY